MNLFGPLTIRENSLNQYHGKEHSLHKMNNNEVHKYYILYNIYFKFEVFYLTVLKVKDTLLLVISPGWIPCLYKNLDSPLIIYRERLGRSTFIFFFPLEKVILELLKMLPFLVCPRLFLQHHR